MENKQQQADALSDMGEAARKRFLEATRPLAAHDGQVLVEKGDRVSDVFLVREGTLRIYASNEMGKEATLFRLQAGDVCLLSLNAAFTNGRYPANVRAESAAARVELVPGQLVRELFSVEPVLQKLVLESLTSTVAGLLSQLDESLMLGLRDRLCNYLSCLANARGEVFLSHQQLADHLGVTREAVSREIGVLRKQGYLQSCRKKITLVP